VDPHHRELIAGAAEGATVWAKDANPEWLDSSIRWIGRGEYGSYRPIGVQLAGQSVGLVDRLQPASNIVHELWRVAGGIAVSVAGQFEDPGSTSAM
jgi:hypothetical protein